MRIGIFTECYLPTLNGVVVSIETFRQEMEKLGHESFIFTPEAKNYEDLDEKHGGPAHVFRFPSFIWPWQKNYPITWPPNRREVIHQVKNLNLDIIHTQHLFTMGRLGLAVGQSLDLPVVHTYHTLIVEYTHYVPVFRGLAKKFFINLSRAYCNQCDQIVTPSPSMKKILIGYGITKPIEPIPTGIELEKLQNPFPEHFIRENWQIPPDRKILLYVSRIAKEKNIGFLFQAFRQLVKFRHHQNGKIDVHLLMVGGGPELPYYQNLVKQWGLNRYITFTDMIKKETVNRYYGVADIFVFPSITETQGIVVTEAMAAGVPVVAVNQMGPSDLIKNNEDGFLTSLKVEEFAAKINKLLNNDALRREMGQNARENAKQYSSLNCALKMEKLYEKTIEQYKQTNRHRSEPKTS